jgi:ATP-dependent DNA helicase DinG
MTNLADELWGEAIPPLGEYVDRTFGAGGYLARKWGPSYQPRDGQVALAYAVDRALTARTHLLSEAPTGCHARGQLVRMSEGADKRVEDIVVGDELMGPDLEPRRVLSLARGTDRMVDIVPLDGGQTWRVNEGHVLTLVHDDVLVDVALREYREWSGVKKFFYQQRRVLYGNREDNIRYGRTAFSVVPTGTVEPFFGFSLDGDGRFLLGDGTVTHNTGKSIAYSVPATYHAATRRQTVVIVTANIALQEQLVKKDLPLLAEVLPWGFSFGLFKGRSNYLCRAQLEKNGFADRQQAMFDDRHLALNPQDRDRARLFEWARMQVGSEAFGDQSALGWKPSDKLWREVSVGPDDCRGRRCAFARTCGALRAQQAARESQVVVTNYHIFFTHLLIAMDRGQDLILPPFDAVIMDECHQAASVARDYYGWSIAEGSVKRAASYYRSSAPDFVERVTRAGAQFFTQMRALRADEHRYKARVVPAMLNASDRRAGDLLLGELVELGHRLDQEHAGAEALRADERLAVLEIAKGRVDKLLGAVRATLEGGGDNEVIFLEEDEFRQVRVVCRLVEPAQVLHDGLFGKTVVREGLPPQPVAVVGTSATLATGGDFAFARRELGVQACEELVVASPFDYGRQALLIIPDGLSAPNDAAFTREVAAVFLRTIELARGRTLGLFTSRKRMNDVYDAVAGRTPFRILRQDDGQRTQLVEEFRRDVHSVLLGVASFWAGVDVPGDSLSCVFIDKLPFPGPDDPIIDRLTETDKRAWQQHAVPRALIEFKQGFGRLIRSSTDRGVVVCCDTRLITKGYGKQFLRALPKDMQKVRNLEAIREWLDVPAAGGAEEIDPLS